MHYGVPRWLSRPLRISLVTRTTSRRSRTTLRRLKATQDSLGFALDMGSDEVVNISSNDSRVERRDLPGVTPWWSLRAGLDLTHDIAGRNMNQIHDSTQYVTKSGGPAPGGPSSGKTASGGPTLLPGLIQRRVSVSTIRLPALFSAAFTSTPCSRIWTSGARPMDWPFRRQRRVIAPNSLAV